MSGITSKPGKDENGEYRPGRPVKMTEKTKATLLDSIAKGNHMKTACMSAKLSYNTFKDWLKKGREGISPYKEFLEEIEWAKAAAEDFHVRVLHTAANDGNIGASQWWLSRMYPDRWGKKDKLDVKKDTKQEITFVPYDKDKHGIKKESD